MPGRGQLSDPGALALFDPMEHETFIALLAVSYTVSHFVNNPHFAHSYQLFLPGLVEALRDTVAPLRLQYLFDGLGVPLLLALFYVSAIAGDSPRVIGHAVNAMLFAVGWHYAKQGYGVLMVACSDKGFRLVPEVRRQLLLNTHLVWIALWLLANRQLAQHDYWGIPYFVLDMPDPIVFAVVGVACLSTVRCVIGFASAVREQKAIPANGLMGYIAAVYVWLGVAFLTPAAAIFVPAFHSFKCLFVVWRYRANLAMGKEAVRSLRRR